MMHAIKLILAAVVVWVFILFAFAFVLAYKANANDDDSKVMTFATCAASQAIVAEKLGGISGDIIGDDAKLYAGFVRDLIRDTKKSNEVLRIVMKLVQAEYNHGHTTWQDLVTTAELCSAELETAGF